MNSPALVQQAARAHHEERLRGSVQTPMGPIWSHTGGDRRPRFRAARLLTDWIVSRGRVARDAVGAPVAW